MKLQFKTGDIVWHKDLGNSIICLTKNDTDLSKTIIDRLLKGKDYLIRMECDESENYLYPVNQSQVRVIPK